MHNTEQRLRRLAQSHDLTLTKSRFRNPERPGFGGYAMRDASTGNIVCGFHPHAFSMTLDEVEEYLSAA